MLRPRVWCGDFTRSLNLEGKERVEYRVVPLKLPFFFAGRDSSRYKPVWQYTRRARYSAGLGSLGVVNIAGSCENRGGGEGEYGRFKEDTGIKPTPNTK